MLRTNILLDKQQHRQIVELAKAEKQTFASIVREMIDEGIRARKHQQWEQAAQRMARAYTDDPDLTAFLTLDSEDFLG